MGVYLWLSLALHLPGTAGEIKRSLPRTLALPSPAYPRRRWRGAGAVVTNDWCIIVIKNCIPRENRKRSFRCGVAVQNYCLCSTFDLTIMILSFRTGRLVWANSIDPDQDNSDQGLRCFPFLLHILDDCVLKPPCSKFRIIVIFGVSEFLGFLRYIECLMHI